MKKIKTYLEPLFDLVFCEKSADIYFYTEKNISSDLNSLEKRKQYVIDNNINVYVDITACICSFGGYDEKHIKSIKFDTYDSLMSYINENFSSQSEVGNFSSFLDYHL